ncbi:retrotransposon protein, putative, ty1-copia subclass [Tanacetum coccineum]
MPLSDKTILDSHCFVHELKKEMNDDLEYVNSLKKELDELNQTKRWIFPNIYDILLDEFKECECLAQKLSKQTESVNKDVHNKLLRVRTLENYKAYDMIQELKTMFEEQGEQELFETVKAFHACKQEDGQSVSSYLLNMKSYLDTLERLGYAMPKELGVGLILNSLNKDNDQFIQNYNMHSMGKTLDGLDAMLKLYEKGILKKVETPAMLDIQEGKIQKDKKKPQGAKGKGKGKNKLAYAPKAKMPPPPKRDNLAKDSIFHHCKDVGHWRRNCPPYHAELKKRKNASVASTSGVFTIELYTFPNKTWVYDTGYGTHICNTSQVLRESRKLKHGAISLYTGNGMRAAVEAIKSFDLILPSGLIIVLDNCHFAPIVTRGVVLISRLVNHGYIHTFTNYGILSMYNVSNKRAKHALDSYYLWHRHLRDINKKRIDMLQRDGLLQPTHDESHEKCMSCMSGKMARKPFPHQVERDKDLLGLIHTGVCEPFRTVSREGANYFITFTDDFSRYGFVYLMKHKHEEHTQPSKNTSEAYNKVAPIEVKPQNVGVPICRSVRIPQVPDRYGYYVDSEEYELEDFNEPPNYKAALADLEFDKWLEDMNTEMQFMRDNQVWYLVDLPSNGRTVGCKWLFKKKIDMDGNVLTFKARLVAKGFTQTYGVDYQETFSLVAEIRAIRILLAIVAFYDYEI